MNQTIEHDFPALMRSFINEALDDDTIRTLCFDYFRPVYNEFFYLSAGLILQFQ